MPVLSVMAIEKRLTALKDTRTHWKASNITVGGYVRFVNERQTGIVKGENEIFILPTRSRPNNLLRLIDAWNKTGASTPVDLCVDLDDPLLGQYENMVVPWNWRIVVGQRGPLSDIYNNAYRRHPNSNWFGFISDDVVPVTSGWDSILIDAAGSHGMAVPSGGETTGGCPHFVLGGYLVRSTGWLSLPGLDRIYIDTVWGDIAKSMGVYREVQSVKLEHRHFSNGKALMDSTYRKHNKAQDKIIYDNWRKQNAYLP